MYEFFINETVTMVNEALGEGYIAKLQKVTKNNGVIYDAICILEENSNISPTIYLNPFFMQFLAGRDISEIVEEIISIHKKNAISHFDTASFVDFSKVSENICFRLVNTKKNKELLKDLPHRNFLDLSIIYYVNVDSIDGCTGSITIHNSHAKMWGVLEEDLYNTASINTKRIRPARLRDLCETMFEITHVEEALHNDCYLYILNCKENFGASTILYDDTPDMLANIFGKNLWLIPSSTEEWLIFPDVDSMDSYTLQKMILEVNSEKLSDEEVLSDHPYYFNYQTREITMED